MAIAPNPYPLAHDDHSERHRQPRADDEHTAEASDRGLFLRVRTDHESRGIAQSVSPGRPPPPSANKHHRQAVSHRQIEDAVGLGMVAHALSPGEHGVVVRHDDRSRGGQAEPIRADSGHAGDQPVGRGVGDQVLLGASAALRGNRQGTVFDEAAGIDQIGDVLSCGAPTLLVPFGHRGFPALIQGEPMTLPDQVEVDSRSIQIDGGS